jgi:hypothetical protein
MLTFISSMNVNLYKQYGERFLYSWLEKAGDNIELIICFEGAGIETVRDKFDSDRIKIINLNSNLLTRFRRIYSQFSEARGILLRQDEETKRFSVTYNHRYDAVRFAFKIFSIQQALHEKNIKNNFAWIDSDIVCLKDFQESNLKVFFPSDECLASYLGREAFPLPNPYSECGFVAYNYSHKDTSRFINDFLNLYAYGEIFALKEWHDCMAFDAVRRIYQNRGVPFLNLSEKFPNADHPFMLSGLGEYFDHLKGPERKKRGFS